MADASDPPTQSLPTPAAEGESMSDIPRLRQLYDDLQLERSSGRQLDFLTLVRAWLLLGYCGNNNGCLTEKEKRNGGGDKKAAASVKLPLQSSNSTPPTTATTTSTNGDATAEVISAEMQQQSDATALIVDKAVLDFLGRYGARLWPSEKALRGHLVKGGFLEFEMDFFPKNGMEGGWFLEPGQRSSGDPRRMCLCTPAGKAVRAYFGEVAGIPFQPNKRWLKDLRIEELFWNVVKAED
jgi:hypothetical protein